MSTTAVIVLSVAVAALVANNVMLSRRLATVTRALSIAWANLESVMVTRGAERQQAADAVADAWDAHRNTGRLVNRAYTSALVDGSTSFETREALRRLAEVVSESTGHPVPEVAPAATPLHDELAAERSR